MCIEPNYQHRESSGVVRVDDVEFLLHSQHKMNEAKVYVPISIRIVSAVTSTCTRLTIVAKAYLSQRAVILPLLKGGKNTVCSTSLRTSCARFTTLLIS